MNPVNCLTATSLACRRHERVLFRDLSFTVEAGEALALTGPNGAGKTSLLRILAGLLQIDEGTVAIHPLLPDPELPIRSIFIGSRDPLKAALTVRELLSSWQSVVFGGGEAELRAALAAFDLIALEAVPCAYLSSGQRRRVSLARLLLGNTASRPLWLLDEPTNALDAAARQRLAECVARHRAAGGMVIAATHEHLAWPALRALDLGVHGKQGPREDPRSDPREGPREDPNTGQHT